MKAFSYVNATNEREAVAALKVDGIALPMAGGQDLLARMKDYIDTPDRVVNLKGALLTTKAVIPVMREQGKGAIVNISSLASIAGGNQVAYEISKAAVNRLTTSIAQANARHGIRCNAVLPGLMDTPMAVAGIARASGQDEEAVRQMRNARVPLGAKMGTAWDTANAALFLASDAASWITGQTLVVDGGALIAAAR